MEVPADAGKVVIGISSLLGLSSSARAVMALFDDPRMSWRLLVIYAARIIITTKPMTNQELVNSVFDE